MFFPDNIFLRSLIIDLITEAFFVLHLNILNKKKQDTH